MEQITRANAEVINNFQSANPIGKNGYTLKVRRTGKTQTWKTRPNEFKIPVKHGLYHSFYIDHNNAHNWLKA